MKLYEQYLKESKKKNKKDKKTMWAKLKNTVKDKGVPAALTASAIGVGIKLMLKGYKRYKQKQEEDKNNETI